MAAPYAGPLTGRMCQCNACGHTFGGERGFDLHRVGGYAPPGSMQGTRRCLTADEMMAAGMTQDERGLWRRPQPALFAAANAESGPSDPVPLRGYRVGNARPEEPDPLHHAA